MSTFACVVAQMTGPTFYAIFVAIAAILILIQQNRPWTAMTLTWKRAHHQRFLFRLARGSWLHPPKLPCIVLCPQTRSLDAPCFFCLLSSRHCGFLFGGGGLEMSLLPQWLACSLNASAHEGTAVKDSTLGGMALAIQFRLHVLAETPSCRKEYRHTATAVFSFLIALLSLSWPKSLQ